MIIIIIEIESILVKAADWIQNTQFQHTKKIGRNQTDDIGRCFVLEYLAHLILRND